MSYAPFTKNGLWLSACIAKVIGYIQSPGLLNAKGAFEGLELCDGKLSRTVLRGKGGRKAPDLPGVFSGANRATRYCIFRIVEKIISSRCYNDNLFVI